MKKYYVGFFKNRDETKLFPKLIQKIEGLDFNHVEIMVYDSDKDQTICYGSVSPRSRAINLNALEKTHELKKAIELSAVLNDDLCYENLFDLTDKRYSTGQILLIYLKIYLKNVLNFLPFIKLNLSRELICTELVASFMIDCCFYDLKQSPEMLTIRDVLEIALRYSNNRGLN